MLFGVHKNTVRGWLKSGLQPIDDRRPTLILGRKLSGFLHARRERARQRCRPGQFYCLRCRAPKDPASRRAEYLPITPTSGNLRGTCSRLRHPHVSAGFIAQVGRCRPAIWKSSCRRHSNV